MEEYKHLEKPEKKFGEKTSKKKNTFYGKKHTEEAKRKMSESGKGKNLGKKHSEEVKKKISESLKGRPSPLKGKNIPEERKKRIALTLSIVNIGHFVSEETRRKMSEARKGKPNYKNRGREVSDETKKKQSLAKLGKKRKPFTEETKQKIREANLGEKNPLWKGGTGGYKYPSEYSSIRLRILKRDNNMCFLCGDFNNLEVHHIDYNKYHNSKENLITLCKKCHGKTKFIKDQSYWEITLQELVKGRK